MCVEKSDEFTRERIPVMLKIDSRLFLWTLFILQLFLIAAILHFSIISGPPRETSLDTGIKFISKYDRKTRRPSQVNQDVVLQQLGNFTRTFAETPYRSVVRRQPLTCFREGTVTDSDGSVEVDFNDTEDVKCRCRAEWHGPDCGQPEVIWRAFVAGKIPLNFSLSHTVRHRLIYFIQTTSAGQQMLEIQILDLIDIVELFVVCDLMEKMTYKHSSLFSAHRNRILLQHHRECTPADMYENLPKSVALRDDDVIIYSPLDGVFNRKAINYFKWYENWPQPVRFRLKYNVYGFFWQHPDSTVLGGFACYHSVFQDHSRDTLNRVLGQEKPAMIVGDLNHYGGWLCKFCAQPIDIVKRLEYEFQHEHFTFDGNSRKIIDVAYVQSLITKGLFVDGKMQLNKVQRFAEKYYTPLYVEQNSWNFDNILTNIYAHWEDDSDDEYL
ncbi:beta-1,4-mannosyl-glycoprotein 4-beta-N-acetylglucosaminyltransferase [Phlebotomus argentipes]|uniref:beta-1,4-mannosyl-glycoprotein 4-beta-N-acetylglucosaminyltransferase n=1 Tax=Phlebotomus argentipes TaxID=94469 RepID=UPI0028930492|nr:beta-1,4-mannosyl-glycoprotein 4-beta-N-acetylglucosaminyltransferase [Phlebotomus argentipes]